MRPQITSVTCGSPLVERVVAKPAAGNAFEVKVKTSYGGDSKTTILKVAAGTASGEISWSSPALDCAHGAGGVGYQFSEGTSGFVVAKTVSYRGTMP